MELKEVVLELGKRLKENKEVVDDRLKFLERFLKAEMPSFRRGLGMQVDESRINFEDVKVDFSNLKSKVKILEGRPKVSYRIDFIETESKFELFHNMFLMSCLNVVVGENDVVKLEIEPCQFCSINIVCEEGSSLVVLEKNFLKNNYNSVVLNILGEKNSKISFIAFQNQSRDGVLFCKRVANLKEGADIVWNLVEIGGGTNILSLVSNLKGDGASARNNTLMLSNLEQQTDLSTTAAHNAGNTKSEILVKCALADKSKAVLRGLIKINKGAKFSSGNQKLDCILLSGDAKVNTIPNLEIKTDQVSCRHSAGTSEIDEEKLFYLESRGISREKAMAHILRGFFEPILKQIDLINVKTDVLRIIEEELSKGTGVSVYA